VSEAISFPRASLRLTRVSFSSAALAFASLVAMAALVELGARSRVARARLGVPSVGTRHYQFDVQVARLEELVRRDGPPDCLIVGNSTAYRGFDPVVVGTAYHARTGRDLRCFTFGVGGLRLDEGSIVARLWTERLRPRLLIYVNGLADYLRRDAGVLQPSAWLDYRLGEPTLTGWLIEHSRAYRYYLRHRRWRTPRYRVERRTWAMYEANTTPDGFGSGSQRVRTRSRRAPRRHVRPTRTPPRYDFHPDIVGAMDRLAGVREHGTRLVLVEPPLAATALTFIAMSPEVAAAIRERAAGLAAERGIPRWDARALAISADSWRDPVHLKGEGARRLSEWLGEQLAGVDEREGRIPGAP
jgi:hypothetical protein